MFVDVGNVLVEMFNDEMLYGESNRYERERSLVKSIGHRNKFKGLDLGIGVNTVKLNNSETLLNVSYYSLSALVKYMNPPKY